MYERGRPLPALLRFPRHSVSYEGACIGEDPVTMVHAWPRADVPYVQTAGAQCNCSNLTFMSWSAHDEFGAMA